MAKTSTFGSRLSEARRARGLEIEEAAFSLSIKPARWKALESDQARAEIEEGLRISILLGVDPYWLALGRQLRRP